MAQPNVVREPSMDEILASIRRIIESNDPVPPGGPTSMPEPEGFSGNAANDDMEDVPLTIDEAFAPRVEAVRTPMHEAPAAEMPDLSHHSHSPEPDAAAQPQRSLSLADVAARVRAASERNPGLRELAPKPNEERAHPATSPLVTGRMAVAGTGRPAETVQVAQDVAPSVPQEPQQAAVAGQGDVAPAAPVAEYEPPAPVSLISLDAGQQVARSFQDLAVAIDQAERRSYDEIAAELLRPMLQEWLDENLPTLVERLVREEIERVARGNRR